MLIVGSLIFVAVGLVVGSLWGWVWMSLVIKGLVPLFCFIVALVLFVIQLSVWKEKKLRKKSQENAPGTEEI